MTKWEEFLVGGIADAEGNTAVCDAILADAPPVLIRQRAVA